MLTLITGGDWDVAGLMESRISGPCLPSLYPVRSGVGNLFSAKGHLDIYNIIRGHHSRAIQNYQLKN
jgi:hypothetical protein